MNLPSLWGGLSFCIQLHAQQSGTRECNKPFLICTSQDPPLHIAKENRSVFLLANGEVRMGNSHCIQEFRCVREWNCRSLRSGRDDKQEVESFDLHFAIWMEGDSVYIRRT
jgi:hypothetical protein